MKPATLGSIRRGLARIRRARRGDAMIASRCETIRAACRLYARKPRAALFVQIAISVRHLALSQKPPQAAAR